MARDSYLEDQFYRMVMKHGLPEPTREYGFHRWRFDFAWEWHRVAVEVDGGTYGGPNLAYHTAGKRYQKDCRKNNQAQLEGWAILRADREMTGSPEFIEIVKKMLLVRASWLRVHKKFPRLTTLTR